MILRNSQYVTGDGVCDRGQCPPAVRGGYSPDHGLRVNPFKLEAYQLSLMDVVRAINKSNLILPTGDVPSARTTTASTPTASFPDMKQIDDLPIKEMGLGCAHQRHRGTKGRFASNPNQRSLCEWRTIGVYARSSKAGTPTPSRLWTAFVTFCNTWRTSQSSSSPKSFSTSRGW